MKLVNAEALSGVVSVEIMLHNERGVPVKKLIPADDVKLLCLGMRKSKGFVLVSEDHALYIANVMPHIAELIDELKLVCNELKKVGDADYFITAVDSLGAPVKPIMQKKLISVATAATSIKNKLEAMELI